MSESTAWNQYPLVVTAYDNGEAEIVPEQSAGLWKATNTGMTQVLSLTNSPLREDIQIILVCATFEEGETVYGIKVEALIGVTQATTTLKTPNDKGVEVGLTIAYNKLIKQLLQG